MPTHDQHIQCPYCDELVVTDVAEKENPYKHKIRFHRTPGGRVCSGSRKIIEATATHASSK